MPYVTMTEAPCGAPSLLATHADRLMQSVDDTVTAKSHSTFTAVRLLRDKTCDSNWVEQIHKMSTVLPVWLH